MIFSMYDLRSCRLVHIYSSSFEILTRSLVTHQLSDLNLSIWKKLLIKFLFYFSGSFLNCCFYRYHRSQCQSHVWKNYFVRKPIYFDQTVVFNGIFTGPRRNKVHTGCAIWIGDILKRYCDFIFGDRYFTSSFLWWGKCLHFDIWNTEIFSKVSKSGTISH